MNQPKSHSAGGGRPSEGRHERRQRARRRALQALYQWQITLQDADEILGQFRLVQDLSQIDEEYFEQMLRGVIDEQADLDTRLQPFLDRPMEQVDMMEQVVLRLGAWELLHSPDVPFRVVLDEAIDLAHRFGAEQGHAYINGVLDKAAKSWRVDEVG
jgi:N utilization substance protein B